MVRQQVMTLNDYIKEPRRDWDDKKWLEHAHVMVHSPWISEHDRDYWRYIIKKIYHGKDVSSESEELL